MSPTLLLHFPGGRLLLDPTTGALGAAWGGSAVVWGQQALPQPVRAVLTDADVGYLHMWSGVTEVALPSAEACWLVDGEEQPVRVRLLPGKHPVAEWP